MTITDEEYTSMEPMLQEINRDFIALPAEEIAENNSFLHELLDTIINRMKENNELFNLLFTRKFYGGSYWDRVKVGRPDEYDVHIQCTLENYTQRLVPSNKPGWVNFHFEQLPNPQIQNRRRRKPYFGIQGMHVLINNEGYLDTEKVMLWFHQTLSIAIGGEKRRKFRYSVIPISQGDISLKFKRHGPAFTFSIEDRFNDNSTINLDFVPTFLFGESQYPQNGFRPNPTTKGETFVVAKPISSNVSIRTRYWRLSFQIQERELMKGLLSFKPALRLLKKMRDKLKHERIASYFIKNIMLLEIDRRPPEFWGNPLSFVFMAVLKFYQSCIQNKRIDFFWYPADNLIAGVSSEDLNIINKKLITIIAAINKNPGNIKLAKYFLTRREFKEFLENQNN